MPVAPVAVLNIVIYMLKRICTWEKDKIPNRNTPMGTEANPTMVNCKKAMLVRATFLLGCEVLKIASSWWLVPDGQVALKFWESLKPQSLRLKDIRGPDHLQPAQLRYLWSPAQYPKLPVTNHPEAVPQPVPVASCMCLGKPLPFFDLILLMLYKLFIILHSDIVGTKHGVSKKDRTFKQNQQNKMECE